MQRRHSEAKVLATIGVFPNWELLDIWSRVTPQAIFSGRKIGRLLSGVESITMRMKQGHVLEAPRNVGFPALGH